MCVKAARTKSNGYKKKEAVKKETSRIMKGKMKEKTIQKKLKTKNTKQNKYISRKEGRNGKKTAKTQNEQKMEGKESKRNKTTTQNKKKRTSC